MSVRACVPVLATCALLTTLAVTTEAGAWCRTTTRRSSVPGECSTSGTPLAWQSVCTGFSLHLAGSPEIAMDVLRRESELAAARWHEVPCDANSTTQPYFQLLRIADTITPTGYNARGVNANTVSFNEVWRQDASHRPGTIAVTIVTFDSMTGEILDADVELNQRSDANPEGFRFTTGMPDMASADLPTILTHEFGHFHGISHSTEATAVMWPEAGLGEQRRNLRTDDVQAICDAYNPAMVPDRSCNPVPYGGFASNPVGGRVTGGCAVGARAALPVGGRSIGGAAIALAMVLARRRRR
jgi:hypothetical protein